MIKDKIHSDGGQGSFRPKEVKLPWPKVFLGIAVTATIAGAFFATKTLVGVEKNIAQVKENARPANLKLTKITAPDCTDCFPVDQAVETLKKQNVSIGEEKALAYDSLQAQSFIRQYEIKRVPTYILTGEITKKSLEAFVKANGQAKDDAFIFTKVTPVFIDPESRRETGRVTATYLTDSACPGCLNPKLTVESYKGAKVNIAKELELPWNSPAAQRLISLYKITKVPTFIFSSDIDVYENVKSAWSGVGTIEQDKAYVARNLYLPYRDLEKGQILGLVDVIYLVDSSCSDCYKPETVQKNILTQGFGVGLRSERTVDIASGEGKGLVAKYKITKVPTILLSSGADQYVQLKNIWKSVGTVETDGRYVFREMRQLGDIAYKDLSAKQVVRPAAQTGGQAQP